MSKKGKMEKKRKRSRGPISLFIFPDGEKREKVLVVVWVFLIR